MSSPTLDEVLAGIARALESIDTLRAHATEPEDPNFPTAYPRLVDWTLDTTFGFDCDTAPTLYHFDIWVLVDKAPGLGRAQAQLIPYLSPVGRRSVKQALERDASLGGIVDYIRVTSGGVYGTASIANVECLAASMRAECYTQ